MPTKRTNRVHGSSLPREVIAVLGLGTGFHSYDRALLHLWWRQHGEQLTAYWWRKFGSSPWGEVVFGKAEARDGH